MRNLVIIGAGGFGREVASWAVAAGWNVRGYLDDNLLAARDLRISFPIISPIAAYEPHPDDWFVCGIGSPEKRRATMEAVEQRGGRFAKVVHPTAVVADSAKIGDGVVLCPFCIVSADAYVGSGTAVYYHCSIDHDAKIGSWCQISAHCDIMGDAEVGNSVFIGSHAAVLPQLRVGARAIIGAGAVVTRDVDEGGVVFGVPARPRTV